jgi:hypothetical protein
MLILIRLFLRDGTKGLLSQASAQRLDANSVAARRQAFRLGGSWDEGRIRPDHPLIKQMA